MKTPSFQEMTEAGKKILGAVETKIINDKMKQYQAVNKTLGPILKQSRTRNIYIKKRDKYFDKKRRK